MKLRYLLLIVLSAFLLSSCTFQEPEEDNKIDEPIIEEPIEGGELSIGINIDNINIDPLGYKFEQSSIYNLDLVLYRGLLKYDEQLQLKVDLAESFDINQEGKTINIRLKNNIKFEDGTPITIEDIKFTYQLYSSSHYNGKWKDYTYNIQGVEQYRVKKEDEVSGIIIDSENNNLIINYNSLNVEDLQLFTAPILSKKQLDNKTMEEIINESNNGRVLSSGPYKLETNSDDEIILGRNINYENKVYLDKIKFIQYEENIDYNMVFGLPKVNNNEDKEITTLEGNGYQYLGLNLNNDYLMNKSLREEIALGLNYDKIITDIYYNYADRPLSIIHPKSWLYNATEINYSNNNQTLTNYKDELSFDLAYEDTPFYESLALEIKNQLEQIGIIVSLNPIPKDEYIAKLFYKGEYDLFIANWQYEYDPYLENEKWLAKNDAIEGGYNIIHLNDKYSDQLLIQGKETIDEVKRKELYSDWQTYFMNEYFIIPIASPQIIIVTDKNLNIDINNSLVPYYNIENWWLGPEEAPIENKDNLKIIN